ncbi:T9SS type A sorting domain-containing protein [Flavobacterium sp.]|jgi:hypothetical protein|uniref:T9SS type A sorting domain-containing protein n=1 Tax=Flavobacterium sp. TaxID=239 RepID=UPI0037BEA6CB
MKKVTTILLLLFALLINAQTTYIPMPNGYGIYDPNGFVNGACNPMFKYNEFLYCKAFVPTGVSGFAGTIFKVNMTTNEVTTITGDPLTWDYDLQSLGNVQVYNGEIFFKGWQTKIYKLNPINNTVTHLTNLDYDFIPFDGKLITAGNSTSYFYDLNNGNITNPSKTDINNNPIDYYNFSTLFNINNSIYASGSFWSNQTPANKIFKIESGQISNFSIIYSDPYAYLTGLENITGKPLLINNHLLYRSSNSTNDLSILSLDLNDNSVSTIFSWNSVTDNYQGYYILNNSIYFQKNNITYQSNGSAVAIATNLPMIFNSEFISSPYCSIYGGCRENTISVNNKVFGNKYLINPNTNIAYWEVWKSDGNLSGTSIISNQRLDYGIALNNKLYFQDVSDYYHSTITTYDDATNQFSTVFSFPNNYGNFASPLFGNNNNIFFTTMSSGFSQPGLYKLDLSTLSTTEVKSQQYGITVFPNPTNNYITIQSNENTTEKFDYKIVDLTGRIVKNGNSKFNEQINIESLTSGNYIIQIETENGEKFTEKLIKN